MTATDDLRRATDLVPANLRAAARKVLMYQELIDPLLPERGNVIARETTLDLWCALTGLTDYREALALAREIAGDVT